MTPIAAQSIQRLEPFDHPPAPGWRVVTAAGQLEMRTGIGFRAATSIANQTTHCTAVPAAASLRSSVYSATVIAASVTISGALVESGGFIGARSIGSSVAATKNPPSDITRSCHCIEELP